MDGQVRGENGPSPELYEVRVQSVSLSVCLWVRDGICYFLLVIECLASILVAYSFGFIMVIQSHSYSFYERMVSE